MLPHKLLVAICPITVHSQSAPATRTSTGTCFDVAISNVPGPQTDLYWNGAHLEEIYPVSKAIGGQALNVTMCSYADRVTSAMFPAGT